MKKLPTSLSLSASTSKTSSRGFTLVEILVAITIIAVLAAVGIVVFGGVQARSRDARRSQDLDSIANALEGKKLAGSIFYTGLATTDFATGSIPADPKNTTQKYCFWGKTTVPPTAPMAKPTSAAVNWTTCSGPTADYTAVIAAAVPTDTTKVTSWTICAKQEAVTDGVECKFSKL